LKKVNWLLGFFSLLWSFISDETPPHRLSISGQDGINVGFHQLGGLLCLPVFDRVEDSPVLFN
jgi:hypothetical protein